MTTINLLPWRQERRDQLKKEFLVILGGFVAVAAVIIFLWQLILSSSIESQQQTNAYLQSKITELDAQVKEIADLRDQKQKLVERMQVIQNLQGNRPEIVHIFDELVRTLPDGVYYKSIIRNGSAIALVGTAESNNRVSSLMRQLDNSEWFANPSLQLVSANPSFGEQATDFTMSVIITPPVEEAPTNSKIKK